MGTLMYKKKVSKKIISKLKKKRKKKEDYEYNGNNAPGNPV